MVVIRRTRRNEALVTRYTRHSAWLGPLAEQNVELLVFLMVPESGFRRRPWNQKTKIVISTFYNLPFLPTSLTPFLHSGGQVLWMLMLPMAWMHHSLMAVSPMFSTQCWMKPWLLQTPDVAEQESEGIGHEESQGSQVLAWPLRRELTWVRFG